MGMFAPIHDAADFSCSLMKLLVLGM